MANRLGRFVPETRCEQAAAIAVPPWGWAKVPPTGKAKQSSLVVYFESRGGMGFATTSTTRPAWRRNARGLIPCPLLCQNVSASIPGAAVPRSAGQVKKLAPGAPPVAEEPG